MSMTINTNMASLNAQRNLSKTQGALGKSLERLSSGLRINSAKDDAAGLAISTRFTAQIKGLDQSVRNANDGISLLQTSEGAMQEVTSLLQRMREISVQASNDTYSTSDRNSLQGEVDQLYKEIDRISASTQFNGINLLDGSGGERSFQIGANAGQSISVELKSVSTKALDLNMSPLGELNGGRVTTAIDGLFINATAIGPAAHATAMDAAAAINLKTFYADGTAQTGVTATAYNVVKGVTGSGVVATGDLTINGMAVKASTGMDDLVANINAGSYGVKATLNEDKSITLSNETGEDITVDGADPTAAGFDSIDGTPQHGYVALTDDAGQAIKITGATAAVNSWGFNVSTGSDSVTGGPALFAADLLSEDLVINDVIVGGATKGTDAITSAESFVDAINLVKAQTGVFASDDGAGNITLTSLSNSDIVISGNNVAKAGFVAQGGSSDVADEGLSMESIAKANEAIDRIDDALNSVSSNRADLGAVQNRMESTISNLMNVSENLSAANGRIMDADFAAETASMSKQQILMQAGVAMLAQAKALPQQVLQLLQ